jgi:ribosomal protein L11 methyltransferase
MDWLEITVKTASGGIEEVAAALTAGGFSDLVLEDQAEFTDFLDLNRAYWDYIDEALEQKLQGLSCIKLYLEDGDEARLARLKALLDGLKQKDREHRLGSLDLTCAPLAQTNWEESWKENYPPQEIGDTLVVLPCWLSDLDTQGRKPVILDPGLTFGTGAHPSTQMVMEAMEQRLHPGGSCLDLGSGSGILSIAALRLGARSAIGVDIDPKAEDIARENCAYNGFSSPEFTALTGNVLTDKALMGRLCENEYDLVLVNIVADVIISLAPVLPRLMHSGSTLICSGILDTRLPEVTAALRQAGLEIIQTLAKEDWRCTICKRSNL